MKPLLMAMVGVLALAGCADAPEPDGFAGLADAGPADTGVPFLQPRPGDRITLPADLGPHPQHRIEWWYLTANLRTDDGQPLGLQWTQFRQALQPRRPSDPAPDPQRWPRHSAWMAHAAVSFKGQHRFAERLARGDLGQAGAQAEPFRVWLDHWELTATGVPGQWRLTVAQPAADGASPWRFELTLSVAGEPVRHGQQGFSAKSASGEGSMYFSLVDIRIDGTVTLGERRLAVSGQGWFDREWSSQFLKAGQQGWDWFALHLDSGDKLMAFQLREEDGGFRAGTWIPAHGTPVALTGEDLTLEALAHRGAVPIRWRLRVPDQGVALEVSAPPGDYLNRGLYPYWESPVSISGSHAGEGYMELTGYLDR